MGVDKNWHDEAESITVWCKYCGTSIELSKAIITNNKGKFTGYSCGCHTKNKTKPKNQS